MGQSFHPRAVCLYFVRKKLMIFLYNEEAEGKEIQTEGWKTYMVIQIGMPDKRC